AAFLTVPTSFVWLGLAPATAIVPISEGMVESIGVSNVSVESVGAAVTRRSPAPTRRRVQVSPSTSMPVIVLASRRRDSRPSGEGRRARERWRRVVMDRDSLPRARAMSHAVVSTAPRHLAPVPHPRIGGAAARSAPEVAPPPYRPLSATLLIKSRESGE